MSAGQLPPSGTASKEDTAVLDESDINRVEFNLEEIKRAFISVSEIVSGLRLERKTFLQLSRYLDDCSFHYDMAKRILSGDGGGRR